MSPLRGATHCARVDERGNGPVMGLVTVTVLLELDRPTAYRKEL